MVVMKVGNFNQIGVSFQRVEVPVMATRMESFNMVGAGTESERNVHLAKSVSIEALPEMSFKLKTPGLNLVKSSGRWGLYIKSLSLFKDFEGFIVNVFKPTNRIYFTSITWDYSGSAPFVYPPKNTKASDLMIPLKARTTRRFIGDGINIWPPKPVVGALNIVIIVFECDKDLADYGQTLASIHDTVEGSGLTQIASSISTSPSAALAGTIASAVTDVIGAIGAIMKRNHADYVDLFEGSYDAQRSQTSKTEKYDQECAGIELDFSVT